MLVIATMLLTGCGDDGEQPYGPQFERPETSAQAESQSEDQDDADERDDDDRDDDQDDADERDGESDDASDPERPATHTASGWTGTSVRCKYGDTWVYAARGGSGQVVICLDDDELYVVDADNAYEGSGAYTATNAVCPVRGSGDQRYVWGHADTGWTEYNGTTRYIMDIFSGEGEMDLTGVDNLVTDPYDGAWSNSDVELPELQWCSEPRDSPAEKLLAG